MDTVTTTCRASSLVPSPPYPGERVRVRGRELANVINLKLASPRPLTLALSPDYRGEGTRAHRDGGNS